MTQSSVYEVDRRFARALRESVEAYLLCISHLSDHDGCLGETEVKQLLAQLSVEQGHVALDAEKLRRLVWMLDLLSVLTRQTDAASPYRKYASKLKINYSKVFSGSVYPH